MILKQLLTVAGIFMVLAACGQSDSFTIEATITGIAEGTTIQLIPGATHQEEKAVAETTVIGGKFSFTLNVPEARMFVLVPGYVRILTKNGEKINLTATAEKGEQAYSLTDVVITGSPLTDQYHQKVAPREGLDEMYRKYHHDNREISQQIGAARASKDEALLKELTASDAYKKLAADEKAFFDTVKATYKQIFNENSDSWWGPLLILDLHSYLTEEQKEEYDALSESAKISHYGKIVKKYVSPDSFIGHPLPAFTLKNDDGNDTKLEELVKGKKYLLVDFWASWCGPCRKEIPNLKELYKQYSDKGFEIVSISTDKDRQAWQKALEEEQLPWPNYRDDGSASKACNVRFIPLIYLLDEHGNVIEENIKGEELKKKLSELLD